MWLWTRAAEREPAAGGCVATALGLQRVLTFPLELEEWLWVCTTLYDCGCVGKFLWQLQTQLQWPLSKDRFLFFFFLARSPAHCTVLLSENSFFCYLKRTSLDVLSTQSRSPITEEAQDKCLRFITSAASLSRSSRFFKDKRSSVGHWHAKCELALWHVVFATPNSFRGTSNTLPRHQFDKFSHHKIYALFPDPASEMVMLAKPCHINSD